MRPVWFGAFLLGTALIVLATYLIPMEVYEDSFRAIALETGREMPPEAVGMARRFGMLGAPIIWLITTFLYASVAHVTFAFVFGDEGRFKQYLAATCHALLIPALGGLLAVPLKVMTSDLRQTFSLGSILGGALEPGYLLNLLRGIDIFIVLGVAVLAIGATKIDRRRSWGSAFAALLVFAIALAAVFALLQG